MRQVDRFPLPPGRRGGWHGLAVGPAMNSVRRDRLRGLVFAEPGAKLLLDVVAELLEGQKHALMFCRSQAHAAEAFGDIRMLLRCV